MNTQCSAGAIYNPRLVSSDDTLDEPQLEFQVFFRSICKEAYTPEVANTYLQSLLPGSGYALCSGIPSFPTEVRFKPKKYREWTSPFVRHNSRTSKLWHVPSHHKRSPNDPLYNSCPSCKLLWHDLGTLAKRARLTSPSTKAKWQQPSSRRALKYLSPHSCRVRLRQARLDRKEMMKSLKHYRSMTLPSMMTRTVSS